MPRKRQGRSPERWGLKKNAVDKFAFLLQRAFFLFVVMMIQRTQRDFQDLYWHLHWENRTGFSWLIRNKWGDVSFDEICDPSDGTPLLHALLIDIDTWDWLLQRYQPNLNIVDPQGRNLLGYGSHHPHTLLWFLQRGVNPNHYDKSGQSPIMKYVSWNGDVQVDYLLTWGASLKEARQQLALMRNEHKSAAHVRMRSVIQDFVDTRTRCENAVLTLLHCSKGRIHRDLVPVIGRMVWASRRVREIWEMKAPRKK